MRYRQVKNVAFKGNSERCLVLRQLYAQKFLTTLDSKIKIVNVDQTWINSWDFNKKKWRVRGTTNSVKTRNSSRRLSLIVGLDTNGKLYCSVTLANTDSKIMILYLAHLAKILAKRDPGYRNNTCILMDNASYNKSKEVREFIDCAGLRVMWSAPYSYAGSPVELWFSQFKRGNLNPLNLSTGKK